MRSPNKILLSLAFVLALSGCKSIGAAMPVCPKPQAVPAELMTAPNYEEILRGELLEPAPSAMRKSVRSKR